MGTCFTRMSENYTHVVTFRACRDVALRAHLAEAEYRYTQEQVDMNAREEAMRLCPECRAGTHRNPPHGIASCRCPMRWCNCIWSREAPEE